MAATSLTTCLWFTLSLDFFPVAFLLLALAILVVGFTALILLIIATIHSVRRKKMPSTALWAATCGCLLLISVEYLYTHGYFWGRKTLEAAFLDDRSRMDLSLFNDGHYIINTIWLFGETRFSGTYYMAGDTICFTEYPVVDNDFVSQKILREGDSIYFSFDPRTKQYDKSFDYFQIDFGKKNPVKH